MFFRTRQEEASRRQGHNGFPSVGANLYLVRCIYDLEFKVINMSRSHNRSIQNILRLVEEWADNVLIDDIRNLFVFGSSIYKDGRLFDFDLYQSDIDLVAELSSDGMTVLDRTVLCEQLRSEVFALEQKLLVETRSKDASQPMVSTLLVSPLELTWDVHKTTSTGFYSSNDFQNLRTKETGPISQGSFANDGESLNLVSSLQSALSYRNEYLSTSANGTRKVEPHSGPEVLPKKLTRAAAALAHFEHPNPDFNEHDVNAGLHYILRIIDERSGKDSNTKWQEVQDVVEQRVGRGDAALPEELQLLLFEAIFDGAVNLLLSRVEQAPKKGERVDTDVLTYSLSSKSVSVRINLPEKDVTEAKINSVHEAVLDVLKAVGMGELNERDQEDGSFYLFGSAEVLDNEDYNGFRASLSSPAGRHLAAKLASQDQYEALQKLVSALDSVREGVVQVGDILLLKRRGSRSVQILVLDDATRASVEKAAAWKNADAILAIVKDHDNPTEGHRPRSSSFDIATLALEIAKAASSEDVVNMISRSIESDED